VKKVPVLQDEIQCFLYQGYADDGQDFIDMQDQLSYTLIMSNQDLKERLKNEPSARTEWMDERRKAPRLEEKSDVTITVVSEGKHQKVIYDSSKDISVYGAKIHSRLNFPVDTLLEIDFTFNAMQEKITALGKVRWIKVIIEDESYEVGVEFVDTPGDAIKKLGDYISWKQKRKNLNPF
jgi:hypothetical protein